MFACLSPKVIDRNSREIDHGVFVGLLAKEGRDHFRLATGPNKQFDIAPRNRDHETGHLEHKIANASK
jgi:hypothetical protein